MRWTELTLSPAAFAIKTPVQWVVSRGGSPSVGAIARSAPSAAQRLHGRGTRLIAKQAVQPPSIKTFLPRPNAGLGFAGLPHNLVRADAIGDQSARSQPAKRVSEAHSGLERGV